MDKFTKINKEEAKVGDYAYVDGYSGFCYGSYERITDIVTRYDEITGEPYKVIVCGKGLYRFDNGWSINGAMAYSIFHYARKINEI